MRMQRLPSVPPTAQNVPSLSHGSQPVGHQRPSSKLPFLTRFPLSAFICIASQESRLRYFTPSGAGGRRSRSFAAPAGSAPRAAADPARRISAAIPAFVLMARCPPRKARGNNR